MILSVLQIAFLIVLPLILFYQRSQWNQRSYILILAILYFIWYFTYALFHELSHMLGVWITNKTVYNYQLIPHFWKGDFNTGYIHYDFKSDSRDFLIILLPYAKNILLLFVGLFLIEKTRPKSLFIIGLILILCILSPLYDVINNYSAYLLGSLNDFNALKESSNAFTSHFIGISFSLFSLVTTFWVLIKYKNYPINFDIN